MYRIVKIVEDEADVFVVIHAGNNREVFRTGNYAEAYRFVLSK